MHFAERVYAEARKIPPGRVMSYADVARKAGYPLASRAVGNLMSRNPDPGTGPGRIPCHRVVRSDRTLGGFTSEKGPEEKATLLMKEGVLFERGKIRRRFFVRDCLPSK